MSGGIRTHIDGGACFINPYLSTLNATVEDVMRKALLQNNDTVRIVHTVDDALRIVSRNGSELETRRHRFRSWLAWHDLDQRNQNVL